MESELFLSILRNRRETEKIYSSKNEAIEFWESKLNFWVKTDYKIGLIF